MSKYDLNKIAQLVSECSPHGKVQTSHSAFKAYVASMCLGLSSLGLDNEEIIEAFSLTPMQSMQSKALKDILDLIVKTKSLKKGQTDHSLV